MKYVCLTHSFVTVTAGRLLVDVIKIYSEFLILQKGRMSVSGTEFTVIEQRHLLSPNKVRRFSRAEYPINYNFWAANPRLSEPSEFFLVRELGSPEDKFIAKYSTHLIHQWVGGGGTCLVDSLTVRLRAPETTKEFILMKFLSRLNLSPDSIGLDPTESDETIWALPNRLLLVESAMQSEPGWEFEFSILLMERIGPTIAAWMDSWKTRAKEEGFYTLWDLG
jgi:hypothetical protein